MARARKGSVCEFRDERGRLRYKVGITLRDGTRRWQRMPPGTTEARARATADSWNEKSATDSTLAPTQAPAGETVKAYADRWLDERAARGLASVDDDRQRVRDHIAPALGTLLVAHVTKLDLRLLVQALDDKVRAGALAWKTAHHIWALTRTMFGDACSSKRADLVAREDDPTDKVEGPDRGDDLARSYLYPSEFQTLINCEFVPVAWRRLYALAAYTLSRAGELSALRWDAVDLERGVIHFRQATDRRETGRMKSTKTGKARRIPIEPTLRPLLEVLLLEAKTEFVVHVPISKRAEALREHLERAGVTRTELFAPPKDGSVAATWAPLTFHDLRGTGVTWMAIRGDEPLVIQQRAGHANFATTQRYLREAETLGKDAGQPFPPLPPQLLESIRETIRKPLSLRNRGAGHGIRTRPGRADRWQFAA
jgi:integrase